MRNIYISKKRTRKPEPSPQVLEMQAIYDAKK